MRWEHVFFNDPCEPLPWQHGHTCPFPIGWLINRRVSSETRLTTGLFDDRWD